MKKKLLLFSLILCFLCGCKKDKDNTPLVFVDPSAIVLDASMGEIITFKIQASAPEGLKKLVITYKESNTFTQTILDSALSGNKNFKWNYEFKIPTKSSAYNFDLGFVFTDNDGYEFSAGKRINVALSNVVLTEYSGNIFYSKKSGQTDSYDLINKASLFSSVASSFLQDLKNDGTYDAGDSLARSWVSPSGAKFVRFNTFDYINATNTGIANIYESGLPSDTITNLQTGDLLFTKVTRNSMDTYVIIKLTSILDQPGSGNDLYIFSMKK